MPRIMTRADDERDLEILRLTEKGVPPSKIAAIYGLSSARPRQIVEKIRDDLAKSEAR